MADPRPSGSYYDPYGKSIDHGYLDHIFTQPNPSSNVISNYQDPQPVQMLQSSNVGPSPLNENIIGENEDPFSDPVLWNIFVARNEAGPSQTVHEGHGFGGSFEAGPSQTVHEGHGFGGSFEAGPSNTAHEGHGFGGSFQAGPSHTVHGGHDFEAGPSHTVHGGHGFEAGPSHTVHGGHGFGGGFEAGPSQVHEGHNFGGSFEDDLRREGITLDGGRPLPVYPPPPLPFGCTSCNVLRSLIHTDGNYNTKMEIHGRLGLISHAILQTWDQFSAGTSNPQNQMVDFCKKSIEEVKEFLKHYCSDRKSSGFVMLDDPLSTFYEAVMVGIGSEDNLQNDDFADRTPTTSAERPFEPAEFEAERIMPRSHLALQRERAGRLTVKDFETYFDLPIEEAARRLNLCPSVVKKICRRDGMARWPYRKIKSIQRQISNHTAYVNSANAEERANAKAEIARLEQELVILYTGYREG